MKRIVVALCAVVMAASVVQAGDCTWSWWVGDDKSSSDVEGCALGFGTERAEVEGAQVALCMNLAKEAEGAQVTFGYNRAIKFDKGAQVACFNRAKEFRKGAQVGFVNVADSSSLQIGLLCFNKTGVLPFFVFFNFDKAMFRD